MPTDLMNQMLPCSWTPPSLLATYTLPLKAREGPLNPLLSKAVLWQHKQNAAQGTGTSHPASPSSASHPSKLHPASPFAAEL